MVAACALFASDAWSFTVPRGTTHIFSTTTLFAGDDEDEGPILNRWSR